MAWVLLPSCAVASRARQRVAHEGAVPAAEGAARSRGKRGVAFVAAALGALVVLVAVRLRSKSLHTISGTKDGIYQIYYSFGSDWCPTCKAFETDRWDGRFEGTDKFSSSRSVYTQQRWPSAARPEQPDGGRHRGRVPEDVTLRVWRA